MINYAHRGFKGKYPENTMLAFKKAIEAGANGIELDVHLTRDGELVIIHDESLERTTDGFGLVCEKSLAELKALSASKLYPSFEKQEMLTLREYFEFIKDYQIVSNIELKNSIIDYKDIEKKTYDLIKDFGLVDKIIISSFNHRSLIRMKEIDSTIKCGVLESSRLYKPWEYIESLEMEYFHPINFAVDQELVEKCRENNIGLNIWFGISDYDINEYLKYDPAGFITDFPDRISTYL